jgi:hypothetical protein
MFIKISKTKKCMKKVLFLAIAALAYAGSVNAQTVRTPNTLPTEATISILAADGTTPLGLTFRMTNGGTYDFKGTGTDWSATDMLGANWGTAINGSRLNYTTTSAANWTPTPVSNSGVAKNSPTLDLTDVSITASTNLTFTETIVDKADADLTCTSSKTFVLTAIDKPTLTVTMTNLAYCSPTAIPVKMDYNNTGLDYIFRAQLARVGGASPSTNLFTNADQYFDVANVADGDWDVISYCGGATPVAGTYTLSFDEVYDEVSVNAGNKGSLGTVTSSITFAILPSPKPTLTTTAIK